MKFGEVKEALCVIMCTNNWSWIIKAGSVAGGLNRRDTPFLDIDIDV